MAAAFPLPVTAAQVGTYFVRQYYEMLQNQPSFLHQFYSDASSMLRIDGNLMDSASDMLQIHKLIMSLNYAEIEIKTAHSLQSWNLGVLVMVSGSVRLKGFSRRKQFIETFFLAPQDRGYFVLNDMFHYADEEQILQHPMAYMHKSNLEPNLHSSANFQEQVRSYILAEDVHSREFQPAVKIENGVHLNNYGYLEEQNQQVAESRNVVEDGFAVHSNGSVGTLNSLPDRFSSPSPAPEQVGEPQKHTYASILQVAKAQSAPPVTSQASKSSAPSELQQNTEFPTAEPSNPSEISGLEILDETIPLDDEVEMKSVYVKNIPTTMAASEIEEEFKKFGKLTGEGVAIRTRKDIDVCYAFVEFEDMSGVQNAIKASTVLIGGHQLYIEGRRPNRNTPFRGGGRGRGRGRVSYMMDGARGRFGGRSFGRIEGQDGVDYVRPQRANGFYRPTSQRSYHQSSRNDQNLYE